MRRFFFIVILFFFIFSIVGQIHNGTYVNYELGVRISIFQDSTYFTRINPRQYPETYMVAKGYLNKLTPNLHQISQTPINDLLFSNLHIQESSSSTKDSVNIIIKFPGLKNVEQDLSITLNGDYWSSLNEGEAIFKMPKNNKYSQHVGIEGYKMEDNIGNSYFPYVVLSKNSFQIGEHDILLTLPDIYSTKLKIFDINNNYIELASPSVVKWKGYNFYKENVNLVSLENKKVTNCLSSHQRNIKIKNGVYIEKISEKKFSLYDISNYWMSFIVQEDTIKLFVDRDMTLDGRAEDFIYIENFVGSSLIRAIGDNYFGINTEPSKEKLIRNIDLKLIDTLVQPSAIAY